MKGLSREGRQGAWKVYGGDIKLNLLRNSLEHTFCVIDINECASGTHNCHVDANCTNTKGSFYCTCLTGYSGDGVLCEGELSK